jgi:hypothetical protein
MNYLSYKELQKAESKLQKDYRNFILKFLENNDNRVTYRSPKINDDTLSFDDRFPVVVTLYGKHDNHNIGITDIYTIKDSIGHISIYADGIDQEEETEMKGFTIYPEHYSEVASFLMTPVRLQLRKYAYKLALKELVEKYEKLPDFFFEENELIKTKYHEEYHESARYFTTKLEELMKTSSLANTTEEKDNVHSLIMELTDNLSTMELIKSENKLDIEMMIEQSGCLYYKEKYQDEYLGISEAIEAELNIFFNLTTE